MNGHLHQFLLFFRRQSRHPTIHFTPRFLVHLTHDVLQRTLDDDLRALLHGFLHMGLRQALHPRLGRRTQMFACRRQHLLFFQ